jgi:hypothetical protein
MPPESPEEIARRVREIKDGQERYRKEQQEIADRGGLPKVVDAAEFAAAEMPQPPQVIHGVLHRGCKLALGGGSKTFKTWTLLDLALSVSHGEPWLGFSTARTKVCLINLELPEWSLHSRLRAVAHAKGITIEPGWLRVWNLRGHATGYLDFLPRIGAELKGQHLGLLIVDPIYRLYGDADENSAKDIALLLNQFELLAQQTGSANAFAAHFAKGNAAGKESIDRISGSGVFARDPDAILTFTRHETEGAFTVDATLRNCKAVEPFVVRWEHPMMRRDDQLDPVRLKQAKGGRAATFTLRMIMDCLGKRKLTTNEWQRQCAEQDGITRPTFFRLFAQAKKAGLIAKDKKEKWSVSKVSNAASETSDTSKSHIPYRDETTETGKKSKA